MEPGVAADRKKAPLRAAVAGGAEVRTFRYAGDVFSDPDETAGSELIAGPDAALGKRDAWRLQRRGVWPPPPGASPWRYAFAGRGGGGAERAAPVPPEYTLLR